MKKKNRNLCIFEWFSYQFSIVFSIIRAIISSSYKSKKIVVLYFNINNSGINFYKRIFIQAALYFTISSLSVFIEEIGSLRSTTRRQRQRHNFAYLMNESKTFARPSRAFIIVVHFFPVLRREMTISQVIKRT